MITDDEIREKAVELDVNTSNVQRDYVFGWLLSGIYHASPALKDLLILKGGNAFRKAYFTDARFSNDLDFSVETEIDPEILRSELQTVCEYAADNTGIQFGMEENRVQEKRSVDSEVKAYEARLYFKSFHGDEHVDLRVKLDVSQFDRIFLPVQQKSIIHNYSDAGLCDGEVNCQKLEELLASKLLALIRRVHSPDLFDFVYSVFLQKDLPINRLEVIRTFLRKTIYEADPGLAQNLLLNIPFDTIKSFWNKYLVLPKSILLGFDVAETQFRDIIAQIFGLISGEVTGTAGGIFRPGYLSHFSATNRNLILEAGRTNTVIRATYDGLERLVEPYSLVYKVRKDGVGREYFYVWNLEGGRSGGQGIRAYTQDKLTHIELTDQRFEPRYDIELTKSQDQTTAEYFGRSFSRR